MRANAAASLLLVILVLPSAANAQKHDPRDTRLPQEVLDAKTFRVDDGAKDEGALASSRSLISAYEVRDLLKKAGKTVTGQKDSDLYIVLSCFPPEAESIPGLFPGARRIDEKPGQCRMLVGKSKGVWHSDHLVLRESDFGSDSERAMIQRFVDDILEQSTKK